MNPIEQIRAKLEKYPDVRYESDERSIMIPPADEQGFEVSFWLEDDGLFAVYFNGWHEQFTDENEALRCFAFGLSDECRLREVSRGNTPYKWTVEYKKGGVWERDDTVALIFSRFWRPRRERVLQNHLIETGVEK